MQRRQDRGDAFARAPADAVLRRRERLEDRRMRFLQRLRHDARPPSAGPFRILCRTAATPRGPRAFRARYLPVPARILQQRIRPGGFDDAEVLLERFAIGRVYFVVLIRHRTADAVGLLRDRRRPSGAGSRARSRRWRVRRSYGRASRCLRRRAAGCWRAARCRAGRRGCASSASPMNRSSSTGLLESSKPSMCRWCSVNEIES